MTAAPPRILRRVPSARRRADEARFDETQARQRSAALDRADLADVRRSRASMFEYGLDEKDPVVFS